MRFGEVAGPCLSSVSSSLLMYSSVVMGLLRTFFLRFLTLPAPCITDILDACIYRNISIIFLFYGNIYKRSQEWKTIVWIRDTKTFRSSLNVEIDLDLVTPSCLQDLKIENLYILRLVASNNLFSNQQGSLRRIYNGKDKLRCSLGKLKEKAPRHLNQHPEKQMRAISSN